MLNLKYVFLVLLLTASLFTLSRCGVNGTNTSTACSPNVIDNGLQLLVTPLTQGSNTYSFKLCAASQPSDAVYSVYGGVNSSDVSAATINLNGAERVIHIAASTQAGATFQVTFVVSDNFFAIYQDRFDGTQYQLDSSVSMVSPHIITR